MPEVEGLSIERAETGSITLQWEPPSGFSGTYRIAIANDRSPRTHCPNHVVSTGANQVRIDNLLPDTRYTFLICTVTTRADDAAEISEISPGISIDGITEALDPAEVGALTLSQATLGTATFCADWAEVEHAKSYRVSMGVGKVSLAAGCADGVRTTVPTYTFSNLTLNQIYTVRVCAENPDAAKKITAGSLATIVVADVAPPEPHNVALSDITSTSVHFEWMNGGGDTVAYKIAIRDDGSIPATCDEGIVTHTLDASATDYLLTGLSYLKNDAPAHYTYRMCAISLGGSAGPFERFIRKLLPTAADGHS